jgi:hypothetical protein
VNFKNKCKKNNKMFYIGEINTEKINRIRVRKLHPEWKNKNNYRITTLNTLNNKSNIH